MEDYKINNLVIKEVKEKLNLESAAFTANSNVVQRTNEMIYVSGKYHDTEWHTYLATVSLEDDSIELKVD